MSERKLIEELRTRGDQARRVSFETNFFALPGPVQTALYGLAAEVERAADAIEDGVAQGQRTATIAQKLYDSAEAYHGPADDEEECAVCIAMKEWDALAVVLVETQEAAEPDDYTRPGWRMFPVL